MKHKIIINDFISFIDNYINSYDQADVANLKIFYEKFKTLLDKLDSFKETEQYNSGEQVDITKEMQEAAKAWKKLFYLPPMKINQIRRIYPEMIMGLENVKPEDTFQMQRPETPVKKSKFIGD